MNKLCKMLKIAMVLMLIVMSTSITVNAYTNDNVISYITKAHTVNGRTLQLSASQRNSLTQYLQKNPVSDAGADEIISKLETAKSKLANTKATNLSGVDDATKAEVMALVKDAGKIAGLDIQVDTVNEVVTVKDFSGNVIISATSYSALNKDAKKSADSTTSASNNGTTTSTKKLVYTGNDYSVQLKILVAIVAVAIIAIVVKNKSAK